MVLFWLSAHGVLKANQKKKKRGGGGGGGGGIKTCVYTHQTMVSNKT